MRRVVILMILGWLPGCGDVGGGATTGSTTAVSTTEMTGGETTGGGTTGGGTTGGETVGEGGSTTTGVEPTTTTGATGTTTEMGTSTGGSTTGETGTTESAMTTEGTTTGETGESSTTGGSTGEGSPLIIAVVDAYLWADCSLMGGGDPVQGSWYVEFDNTDNPNDTAAVLTSASLTLALDPPFEEPIEAEPKQSPPIAAGDYVSQKQTKLKGDAHSACDHCDEFYALVLEYDEDGVSHHVVEDVTISCMF